MTRTQDTYEEGTLGIALPRTPDTAHFVAKADSATKNGNRESRDAEVY